MAKLLLDLETVGISNAADFCDPVEAPSNWKDPEKIAAYVTEKQADKLAKVALDIDLARIVCVGVEYGGGGGSWVTSLKTEQDEREWLKFTSDKLATSDVVTFNGLAFDMPLVEARLMYHDLAPLNWNLDTYRTNHIDLYQRMTYKGRVQRHRLQWYRKRFGWLDIPETIDASEIGRAVTEGRWRDVEAHCAADIELTKRLAMRYRLWPRPVSVLEDSAQQEVGL
jgi:3'-5' exonuclease